MYVLIFGDEALVVDPNENDDAFELLTVRCIRRVRIILTHEHFDHISGVNAFREKFPCSVLCSQACAIQIPFPAKNLSRHFNALYYEKPENLQESAALSSREYSCEADETFTRTMEIAQHGHMLRLFETPGHSKGSICVMLDNQCIFTGDSLIPGMSVVTKLPGGSSHDYQTYTRPFLDALSPEIWIMPGHFNPGILCDLL
jgi:glyoxylase-like metal-dependent hydrolase (beta-lactamase superfamily II)